MGKRRWLSNGSRGKKAKKDAFVYRSVMGTIYVNRDDIPDVDPETAGEYFRQWLAADPDRDKPGAYFQCWKEKSDEEYMDINKADHAESRRCYLVDDFSLYRAKPDKAYGEKLKSDKLAEQLNNALKLLTDTQKRRLYLYFSDKKSLRQIAELEHVDHKTVFESIKEAEAKIRGYFDKL